MQLQLAVRDDAGVHESDGPLTEIDIQGVGDLVAGDLPALDGNGGAVGSIGRAGELGAVRLERVADRYGSAWSIECAGPFAVDIGGPGRTGSEQESEDDSPGLHRGPLVVICNGTIGGARRRCQPQKEQRRTGVRRAPDQSLNGPDQRRSSIRSTDCSPSETSVARGRSWATAFALVMSTPPLKLAP